MTTLERVERWARQGISTDVTTMILRSEGVADEDIRVSYDAVIDSGHTVSVERGVATIHAPLV